MHLKFSITLLFFLVLFVPYVLIEGKKLKDFIKTAKEKLASTIDNKEKEFKAEKEKIQSGLEKEKNSITSAKEKIASKFDNVSISFEWFQAAKAKAMNEWLAAKSVASAGLKDLPSFDSAKEKIVSVAKSLESVAFRVVMPALKLYASKLFENSIFVRMIGLYQNYLKSKAKYNAPEPECNMSPPQLIENLGYKAEIHNVTTKDGHILEVHRIPFIGKNGKTATGVIFLQHGVISSSATWVLNFRNQSLAFMLADLGFDVWLGNARGNTWSNKHKYLTIKDKEFWNFSWQEMAKYDVPACIDYILEVTHNDKLFCVGHSMGTTMMFAMLSSDDTSHYNDKVEHFFALGPVASVQHVKSEMLKPMMPIVKPLGKILYDVEWYYLLPSDTYAKYFAQYFCALIPMDEICYIIDAVSFGKQGENLNKTRIPVYHSHRPAGVSVKTLEHYSQTYRAKTFQKFDYGKKKNLKLYQQEHPLKYELGNILVPCTLIYGRNDTIATMGEVEFIFSNIKNVTKHQSGNDCSHTDLTTGVYAGIYGNKIIIDILKKYRQIN